MGLIANIIKWNTPLLLLIGMHQYVMVPQSAALIAALEKHPVMARIIGDVKPVPTMNDDGKDYLATLCGSGLKSLVDREFSPHRCLDRPAPSQADWAALSDKWLASMNKQVALLQQMADTDIRTPSAEIAEIGKAGSPKIHTALSGGQSSRVSRDEILPWENRLKNWALALSENSLPQAKKNLAIEIGAAHAGLKWVEAFDKDAQHYELRIVRDLSSPRVILRSAQDASQKARPLLRLLNAWPDSWLAGSIVVVSLAVLLRTGVFAVVVLVATEVLIGLGFLALADFSLFAFPSRRYLLVRQFLDPGISAWWFHPEGRQIFWWQGHSILAGAMFTARLVGTFGKRLYPLTAGMFSPVDALRIWGSLAFAISLAIAASALPGGAIRAEGIMAAAIIGVSWYLAIYSRSINAGVYDNAGFSQSCVTLYGALLVSMVVLIVANDLGHALLLFSAFLLVAVLVPQPVLLILTAIGFCSASLIYLWHSHGLIDQITSLPVARSEMRWALFEEPDRCGPSDLARLGFFIKASAVSGWSLGSIPWQGVATAPGMVASGGIPAQTPSDYAIAMISGLYGWLGAALLSAGAISVFALAMFRSFTVLYASTFPLVRFLAAFAGLGCFIEVARSTLSIGGALAAIPLTGVPLALVAWSPSGLLFQMLYLGLALGLHQQSEMA